MTHNTSQIRGCVFLFALVAIMGLAVWIVSGYQQATRTRNRSTAEARRATTMAMTVAANPPAATTEAWIEAVVETERPTRAAETQTAKRCRQRFAVRDYADCRATIEAIMTATEEAHLALATEYYRTHPTPRPRRP